jgi:AcrR family transcriptional regulator
MVELAPERGYAALTVQEIAQQAGVSKRAFYEHFDGKEECFLATYDLVVRCLVRDVIAAQRGERGPQEQLRAAFAAFAEALAEKPSAARLVLVEAFSAGPSAFPRMRHAFGLFEALVADSLQRSGSGVALPRSIVKGIVAGVARVARARLLSGRERELPGDVDSLLQWALSLCCAGAREVCGPRLVSPPERPAALYGDDSVSGPQRLLGDERVLILSAAAGLAASEGYANLTVPRIRLAAGVSRGAFDAHFESVEDCFLASLELLFGEVLAKARTAYLSADCWSVGIHRALAAACDEIAHDTVLARLAFVEIFAPGSDAVRWRARFIADLGSFLRGSAPPGQRPTAIGAEASIGAVWAALNHHATARRPQLLPQIAGTLSYLVLAPAIGADGAVEAIRLEQAGARGRRETRAAGAEEAYAR